MGHVHPDSSPLQPGVLKHCFGAQITFSGRYPGRQLDKDGGFTGKVTWLNTGVKDFLLKFELLQPLGRGCVCLRC